jgi:hypothetical protein
MKKSARPARRCRACIPAWRSAPRQLTVQTRAGSRCSLWHLLREPRRGLHAAHRRNA